MEPTQGSTGERGGPEAVNSRRSDVWNYFSVSGNDDGTVVATCNFCGQQLVGDSTKGTSHLWRHTKSCQGHGDLPQKRPRQSLLARQATDLGEPSMVLPDASTDNNLQGESFSLTRPAQSSWFNQEDCVDELTRMIAFHGYHPSIVDDECFRSFVHALNPHFQMPSRDAVEGICRHRAQEEKNRLEEDLKRCSGLISLATGIVGGNGQGRALYMACQFIDEEWTLQKRIMQVFMVVSFPPYRHGALLGIEEISIELDEEKLEELSFARTSGQLEHAARGWGLSGRLYSAAWGQELERHLKNKDFLIDLCPDVHHDDEPLSTMLHEFPLKMGLGNFVTYTSDVMNSAVDEVLGMLSPYFEEDCYKAIESLHLDHENQLALLRYLSELGLNHVGIYNSRWYSYYCALEVLHMAYIDSVVALGEPPGMNGIEDITEVFKQPWLSEKQDREQLRSRFKENQLTELLRNILGVAYHAIQKISSSSYPTSNLCIEELMKLREVLHSEEMDARHDVNKAVAYAKIGRLGGEKGVATVLKDARGVLEKFLQESHLYLPIPAVLDPRLKLKSVTDDFNKVFGTEEAERYISQVRQRIEFIFRDHWRKRCNIGVNNGEGSSTTEAQRHLTDLYVTRVFKEVFGMHDTAYITGVKERIEGIFNEHRRKHFNGVTGEGTSSMSAGTSTAAMDMDNNRPDKGMTELERYLADAAIPREECFDVLIWWKENSHRYPTVASMARDALAMPASDVLSPEHLALVRSMTSSYGVVYPAYEAPSDD